MRTAFFIDGFNLYYGALKNTPFRWLDLRAFCQTLLPAGHSFAYVKYFIARVKKTSHDPHAAAHQAVYL